MFLMGVFSQTPVARRSMFHGVSLASGRRAVRHAWPPWLGATRETDDHGARFLGQTLGKIKGQIRSRVFGRFSVLRGPWRPGDGSGSKHGAGYAQNQPRSPIRRPVRGYSGVFFGVGAKR
jgi:hypothetical protein